MTEQNFQSEMRRAQAMQQLSHDPERSEYYAGYLRGLRRAFHGAQFGTAGEHALWLGLIGDADEARNQRGLGYRDGLNFSK